MNVREAIRRLKVNPNDEEAIKAIIGEYDSYINAQIYKFKKNISGMDDDDMRQEVYLVLLKKITPIDLRFSDEEIDSYIKTMIRNKMIRMTRESKRELYNVESIQDVKQRQNDGEELTLEQTLEDVSDNVYKNVEDIDFVENLMSGLSPRAQAIVEIILESEGSIKKIKEELDKHPEYSSSKGVIKRIIESEVKPALEKILLAKK